MAQHNFVDSSRPIDAVWTTFNIQAAGPCILPTSYVIGDHWLFVIDFVTSTLISTLPKRMSGTGMAAELQNSRGGNKVQQETEGRDITLLTD